MLKHLSEHEMICRIVKESERGVPYFCCLPRLARQYLKMLLDLWASSSSDNVRIVAFLCIRKFAVTNMGRGVTIDACLKVRRAVDYSQDC
jgi:nucleolar complex protein 2